jgi:hypothetical protein
MLFSARARILLPAVRSFHRLASKDRTFAHSWLGTGRLESYRLWRPSERARLVLPRARKRTADTVSHVGPARNLVGMSET